MTRNKKRLTQLVIFLLIVFGLIMIKNLLPQYLSQKPDQPFSTVKKDQIKKILLTKDKPTSLYKKGQLWYVKGGAGEFRADEERVNKIIDSFISLSKDDVVSTNKNKHKELGIDRQKIEIKTNSKSYIVYIGNSVGVSKNYVRIGVEDEAFAAEGFEEAFTSDDWRDLLVHLINDETKINSIEINFDDNKTLLTKKRNDWKIADKTAKKDRVDFFLNDLNTLKANDILAKNTLLAQVISGQIKIKENGGEKNITFYSKDEENYLAKASISDYIYQIPAAYVASLKKEEKDFLE